MPVINIDGDRLYLGNDLVGRIAPNIKLITLRDLEARISGMYHSDNPAFKEVPKEDMEVLSDFMEKVRAFAKRSGGLLTVQEIEDILDEAL